MIDKYKMIFYKIFSDEIEEVSESSTIGPMGQFQIQFLYEPTKVYIKLDADRGVFALDIEDEAKDWNSLYRIVKFDNHMTEECLEKALIILKQVLKENDYPMYKSDNHKLYKKEKGIYRRVKDIYAEWQ